MATPTYELIETTTLPSSASSVTFSSITQDYRDLVLVAEVKGASGSGVIGVVLRLNSDTGSNYSYVNMLGDGSTTDSGSGTADKAFIADSVNPDETNAGLFLIQLMDYSATDKHKSGLVRANLASGAVSATAIRWANTSAVTAVEIFNSGAGDEFAAGGTLSLYGIAS